MTSEIRQDLIDALRIDLEYHRHEVEVATEELALKGHEAVARGLQPDSAEFNAYTQNQRQVLDAALYAADEIANRLQHLSEGVRYSPII